MIIPMPRICVFFRVEPGKFVRPEFDRVQLTPI
jgi:hypothetical protein